MDEKDFELAAKLTDAEIERALSLATRRNLSPADWDGSSCADCGEEVSKPRLSHGYYTCIECQTRREHRDKLKR
jgi:RNA polymerase-binding transcription factor DksA